MKDLITYSASDNDDDCLTFGELMKKGAITINHPMFVAPDETADKILFLQSTGRSHMAIIVESSIKELVTELEIVA